MDTVRRSRVHFVHCLLPKAETLSGDVKVPGGESCDTGLMQLDVCLLRAQLRGSKLLDALRIYRQGQDLKMHKIKKHKIKTANDPRYWSVTFILKKIYEERKRFESSDFFPCRFDFSEYRVFLPGFVDLWCFVGLMWPDEMWCFICNLRHSWVCFVKWSFW